MLLAKNSSCLIFVVLFLNACSSNESGPNQVELESPKITQCLRALIPDYFEYSKQFEEIFKRDLSIDGSLQSYGKVYQKLQNDTIFIDVKLSAAEKEDLGRFKFDMSLPLQLYTCTDAFLNEALFTDVQLEFYKSYNKSIEAGGIDCDELAAILLKMDNKSFQSNGIKETTLFYLAYMVFNQAAVWY